MRVQTGARTPCRLRGLALVGRKKMTALLPVMAVLLVSMPIIHLRPFSFLAGIEKEPVFAGKMETVRQEKVSMEPRQGEQLVWSHFRMVDVPEDTIVLPRSYQLEHTDAHGSQAVVSHNSMFRYNSLRRALMQEQGPAVLRMLKKHFPLQSGVTRFPFKKKSD